MPKKHAKLAKKKAAKKTAKMKPAHPSSDAAPQVLQPGLQAQHGQGIPEPSSEDVAVRPAFLVSLDGIRPLIEQFLTSFDPSEINYIGGTRFPALCRNFVRAWTIDRSNWQNAARVGKTLIEMRTIPSRMADLNLHIKQAKNREKQQLALEELAGEFLRLHDKLLNVFGN